MSTESIAYWIATRRQHNLSTTYLQDLRFTSERDAVVTMTTDVERGYRWRHLNEAEVACRMGAAILGGAWATLMVMRAEPCTPLDPAVGAT